MFVVTEAQAAMIRATYEQRGEFSAAVELRQLFPGITDNAQARLCVRTIAGWRPLPKRLRPGGCELLKSAEWACASDGPLPAMIVHELRGRCTVNSL